MDKSQVISLYDQDQRNDVKYPDMRREVTPNVVRHVDTSDIGEGILSYSQFSEADADDTVREQVSYFESIGQDFEWKLYDYDQPPDLRERVKSHGFIVEEAEAIMVLDLENAPGIFWQPIRHNIQKIINLEE